jgi:predicted ATPase
MHLQKVRFGKNTTTRKNGFPFNIPSLEAIDNIEFKSPVTFLVGENGSGKSTFMEALAIASEAIAAGSHEVLEDSSLEHIHPLAEDMQLEWKARPVRGLYVRAEDFFGYTKRLKQIRAELEAESRVVADELDEHSVMAKLLSQSPFQRELQDLKDRYGDDLDSHSHGESFMKFFENRLKPNYLHLLDEPEAPFSPSLQFTLMTYISQLVSDGAQFIIATHSPLLLAFPGAMILSMDSSPLCESKYDELEHISFFRSFLKNPDSYLRYLDSID